MDDSAILQRKEVIPTDDINTDETTFSEFYLKYDEELEHFWGLLLQNIVINIEDAHEENTLSQGKDNAVSKNSDVMQEILLQGLQHCH